MATGSYSPSTNDILHNIDLDLVNRSQVVEPLHLVQNDKTLPVLAASLFKNGVTYSCPSGSTVSIRWEKPDNKIVYIPVSGWDSSRHIVYIKTTYQMTSVYGQARAVFEIVMGDSVVQTEPFLIFIDRNPVQDSSMESTDEIQSLQAYVDAAAASANQAKTYRDNAGTYANSARSSASEASSSKTQASSYANNASSSASSALSSKNAAASSASEAGDYSDQSRSYAVGTNNVIRPNDKTDNARFYAELAQQLTERATELLETATELLNQVNPEGAINPDTAITFTPATTVANLVSGVDSVATAFGKFSKLYTELESGQLGNAFSGDITGNRALISDADGKIASSGITNAELNALDGISGNVQEKLTELAGNIGSSTILKAYNVQNWQSDFDFNDASISPGMYRLVSASHLLNSPGSDISYGNVLVIKYPNMDTLTMLAFSYSAKKIYIRSGTTTSFPNNEWNTILLTSDIKNKKVRLESITFDARGIYYKTEFNFSGMTNIISGYISNWNSPTDTIPYGLMIDHDSGFLFITGKPNGTLSWIEICLIYL